MSRPTLVRLSIFLATVVAAWGVLSLGPGPPDMDLQPGRPAPQTFLAERAMDVEDVQATERARQEARDGVDEDRARQIDSEAETAVQTSIQQLFDDIEGVVIGDPIDLPPLVIPELPADEDTEPPGEEDPEAEEAEASLITGRVFVDVDADGVFAPEVEADLVDRGLAGVRVEIRTGVDSEPLTAVTGPEGVWSIDVEPGSVVVAVDPEDPAIPEGFVPGTEELAWLIECDPGAECTVGEVGFVPNLRTVEEAAEMIGGLPIETRRFLVSVASEDVIRAALGQPVHLGVIRQETLGRVLEEFGRRITPEELQEARERQRNQPRRVFHPETGEEIPGSEAVGEVVAAFLQANYRVNPDLLGELQETAAESVEPVMVSFVEQEEIVRQNVVLTDFHIAAISATAAPSVAGEGSGGLLAVVALLVALLGLYLARFRPEFWGRPRMVALLGILVVLAAAAVRGTTALAEATSWYILPAVAFGFMAAVLFDQRIALLIALAVGVLTAVGTVDIGITTYAVLAAMAPIPFVSSVSTRGAFRNAVVFSALVVAAIAAATSWTFHLGAEDTVLEVVGTSMLWAFGVSVVVSMIGLAALQYFESAFDITTALSLLDLTDRNHEGLQLLQEKAFGTFNHSLMVGTLADAAARAIGANALLARAMAYYHDLGKTENPTYFIENQFGIPNPHDLLDPKESADIIRGHVTAGVALARKFKIPTDVTQGIVSHHGDGVMRYFYEKARQMRGDEVDVDDFRHIGHKPRSAETAILMLADALEAACRAVFQTEEPTPDAIEKVVDRIMDEKVEDGQLSEAPVTLAELTKIRKAFLESLVGHYHQRIAYPNFPGT